MIAGSPHPLRRTRAKERRRVVGQGRRSNTSWLVAGLLALLLAPLLAAAPAVGAATGDKALGRSGTAANVPGGEAVGLEPLGQLSLPGFNADVWAHEGYAYVGTWGLASGYPARCPATGVRIIDLSDPANPTLVGAVATIQGTSQEDVEVISVATPSFTGDLLVTGIQACIRSSDAPRGLDLWNVTDPRSPEHLGFWSSGPARTGAGGGHELHLIVRGGRVYALVAVPYAEYYEDAGDFRLVDITDPRNPVQVSAWGATLDGGIRPLSGQTFFGHSVAVNAAGTTAIVSYWDAGAIFLDITDPTRPIYRGRTTYATGGATHSATLFANETLLLTTDEYSGPRGGRWGGLRVWDVRNQGTPTQQAEFLTPNAASGRPGAAFQYTIHNPVVVGTTAYLSWYADGVRVLDLANPAAPREIGSYVPPAVGDPFGYHPTAPMVWGVVAAGDLLLLSDINAGLYVLRTPFSGPACFGATGRCVQGRFLDYWRTHGGLAINGFPISDEFTETLEDGKQYTVQYFERVRMEYHPNAPDPYKVQLGQFGRRIHGGADPAVLPKPGDRFFTETGHNVPEDFYAYWQTNGGLTQFGYPITEVIRERLENGQEYEVQYFERARFERHPENAAPYTILLGQFGRRILGNR
jgi:hypothetical protein